MRVALGGVLTLLVVAVCGGRFGLGGWWRCGGCNLASASEPATVASLAILRAAILVYSEEHGGAVPSLAAVVEQLTEYSDLAGTSTSLPGDAVYCLGPYLRSVPCLPVGANKGMNGIGASDGAGVGWIYDEKTGAIRANTTCEVDPRGRLYSDY